MILHAHLYSLVFVWLSPRLRENAAVAERLRVACDARGRLGDGIADTRACT